MKEDGEKTFGERLVEAAEEMAAVHRGELKPARIDRWVQDEAGEWQRIEEEPDGEEAWEIPRAPS